MKKRKYNKVKNIKVGMPPGSLVFTGQKKMDSSLITLIQYNEQEYFEKQYENIEDALDSMNEFTGVNWLNIDGLHDEELVEKTGAYFQIHKLCLEDILSINQRPKQEDYKSYLFIVLKMISLDKDNQELDPEQVSLLLKENHLVTFQEKSGDVFQHVRKRIHEGKGNIRKKQTDYLMYALLDAIVDYYYVILEHYGEKIDEIESQLLDNSEKNIMHQIHHVRKEILFIRRSVYPLREMIHQLQQYETEFIKSENKVFLRDLYDHTIQIIETIEVFRDMASGLLDIYMNTLSHRMNAIMKTLTIIATIFIPLTFIVGIYGMNFEYMPELAWRWAYFAILGFMTLVVMGMLFYFRKRKWL
ncbi:MAG: magnesium and cobalt transport protein CorA [Chitinophagaceae bacterium]|nr:MAG: magnesium and cobalt transport protein CorA [Chitinophagaceae bacterium]